MRKVLVTGGAGFIGSHTVVALAEAGYEAVLVDNYTNSSPKVIERLEAITGKKLAVYAVNCVDRRAMNDVFLREKPFHGAIHFAAFKAVGDSVAHPLKYYHNNIESLVVLLELMHQYKVPDFVFSSSCTVYGQPDLLPVTEETPWKPAESPYGYTKQICERIIRDDAATSPEMHTTMLRYFNPIGAHPSGLIGELPLGRPENLIPYVTQAAAGLRDKLTVFGNDYDTPDGTCLRDYIHVVDLAEAHVKALDWLQQAKPTNPEVFNLGTGQANSVKEVIDTFEEATGVPVPHTYGPRRMGDVEQIWADVTKATDVLGWHTTRTLRDCLTDAWRWQQNLLNETKP